MAFDAAEDAQALRTAMKGFGTDDNALISIIASKSNAQLQEIRAAYQSEFGKDLISDIQSECSGLFEDVLVGLLLTPAEFDASTCNKAIKGAGTDEDILVETLAHRTDKEMEALQEAYQQKYNTSLTSDVEGDASGHAKLVLLGLINKNSAAIRLDPDYLREVCTTLYNAGEGKIGTDEAVFIDTLTNLDSVYLRALNVTYARMYGDSLVSAASQEMSGTLVEAIKALLAPQYEYYADILFKCLDGAGTDEARMNRIICSRREQLPWINEVFIHKYGMSLHHRVCTEVGGDAGKVISAITKNV